MDLSNLKGPENRKKSRRVGRGEASGVVKLAEKATRDRSPAQGATYTPRLRAAKCLSRGACPKKVLQMFSRSDTTSFM